MEISAEEALRAVKKCYPSLLKPRLLPISELIVHFYSINLLSNHQKSKLDRCNESEDKIKYFLDDMLIPGLNICYTGHFIAMVSLMKDNDDVITRHLVEKLMADASTDASTEASTNTSPLTSPTGTGISNADCNRPFCSLKI